MTKTRKTHWILGIGGIVLVSVGLALVAYAKGKG